MPRLKLELPESFVFACDIPVRITDINYGKHLSNDAVLSIMHEARMQFLKQYNCSELDVFGVSLIMGDVSVIFKSEGFYGDVLKVGVTPADFSRVSFDLYYRITNQKGNEVALAKTSMVCFNYDIRKVAAVPDKFTQLFI